MGVNIKAAKTGTSDNGETVNLTRDDRLIDPNTGTFLNTLSVSDGDYSSDTATLNISQTDDMVSIANLGAWNSVKTAKVFMTSDELSGKSLQIDNIVHTLAIVNGDENVDLTIDGAKRGLARTDDGDDTVTIGLSSNGAGWNNLFKVVTRDGNDTVVIRGAQDAGAASNDTSGQYSEVRVHLGNGNDQFSVAEGFTPDITVNGGNGNDTLSGSAGDDIMNGGNDEDVLDGGAGNDTLRGSSGNDTLNGDEGDDLLGGGNGTDQINGGGGDDKMGGGNDNDVLNGDTGNDTLHGGDGEDTLTGGIGDDVLNGGNDNDVLNGDTGNDTLHGGDGNDTLNGGDGDDNMKGGNDNDVLYGDAGNDTLRGASGNDTISGGDGDDILGGGNDNDTLDGDAGKDKLYGGDGDDSLTGGDGNDSLYGGDGNDVLQGGDGADFLHGQDGNDTIFAGANDTARGASGNDTYMILSSGVTISHFDHTGDDLDLIDLSAFTIEQFEDLTLQQSGRDVIVGWDEDSTLILGNVKTDQLSESHFTGFTGVAEEDTTTGGEDTTTGGEDTTTGGEDTTTGGEGTLPQVTGDILIGQKTYGEGIGLLTYGDFGDYNIQDVNGDGHYDIVSHNGAYGSQLVWYDSANNFETSYLFYRDPGNYRLVDMNNDGFKDLVTDDRGGLGWYDGTDLTQYTQITYNTVDENYIVADVDQNGQMDIVSEGVTYANGDPIEGIVWYTQDGTMNRFTYNNAGGKYDVADMDGDGDMELITNGGSYSSGVAINGFVYYELDGTQTQYSYLNGGDDFIVGQFDDDLAAEILVDRPWYSSGVHTVEVAIMDENFTRKTLTYNDLGDYITADYDNDGILEVISTNGVYSSGVAYTGIVKYDTDGTSERLAYQDVNQLDTFDVNGDGQLDVLAKGDSFADALVGVYDQAGYDVLIGTDDNDALTGGTMDDIMTGGLGDDQFFFQNASGNDIITDFQIGDVLAFVDMLGITEVNDVLDAVAVVGADTVITHNSGSITLQDFTGLTETDIVIF